MVQRVSRQVRRENGGRKRNAENGAGRKNGRPAEPRKAQKGEKCRTVYGGE